MKAVYLKNFRRGLATNSSSTHSLIYRNKDELFKDLDVLEVNWYDRCTSTIAASRKAKIKYVLANIMYNESLVKIMASFYPEMKKYYPLIKKQFKADDDTNYRHNHEIFGMYFRGSLYFEDNIEASVDYLRNVIENDDIIIVGGSDEMDFVYDTIEGHEELSMPEVYSNRGIRGVSKNGNYWVCFGESDEKYKNAFSGRVRFSERDEPLVPEYPELIDLKITNKCDNGCPMCFMSSDGKGQHADITFLLDVVRQCQTRTEFSIGGGSVLLYPDLDKLLMMMSERGHIVNVTINVKDCDKVLNNNKLSDIFKKYVNGIGISVFTEEDANKAVDFQKKFNEDLDWSKKKYIVAHIIPEYIGLDNAKKILSVLKSKDVYMPSLFLGYKPMGRGEDKPYTLFTREEFKELTKDMYCLSIDTTFANRYKDFIEKDFSYRNTITLNEGEYSMYIDGTKKKAYKSSYQLDKPYAMDYKDVNEYYKLKEAFAEIRKDNGFKTYSEVEKHYFDE